MYKYLSFFIQSVSGLLFLLLNNFLEFPLFQRRPVIGIHKFYSVSLEQKLTVQAIKSCCSMASSSHNGGGYYGADPFRSTEGLTSRPVINFNEIQLLIDPMHVDLDDEINGLRKQAKLLKNVASEIESEAKNQNEFINQLQMSLMKAEAGVKNNMRKLNKSIIQSGSYHVVLFAPFCVFLVYMWSKVSTR